VLDNRRQREDKIEQTADSMYLCVDAISHGYLHCFVEVLLVWGMSWLSKSIQQTADHREQATDIRQLAADSMGKEDRNHIRRCEHKTVEE
jgi:hypothetical protein